jgi:hypothetical protein
VKRHTVHNAGTQTATPEPFEYATGMYSFVGVYNSKRWVLEFNYQDSVEEANDQSMQYNVSGFNRVPRVPVES